MIVFDSSLIIALIILLPLLLVILLLLLTSNTSSSQRRPKRACTQAITATITDIHIEAGTLSNGWVITAQWFSPSFPQPLVFASPHLTYRPHHQIGDTLLVYIDPNNPNQYRMQLDD